LDPAGELALTLRVERLPLADLGEHPSDEPAFLLVDPHLPQIDIWRTSATSDSEVSGPPR